MSDRVSFKRTLMFEAIQYDGTPESWEEISDFLHERDADCAPLLSDGGAGIWVRGHMTLVEPGQWVSDLGDWSVHNEKPESVLA